MQLEEETCGQELAGAAEVPELLGELWQHIASNLVVHAKWVGTSTPAAAAEHDALLNVATEYRSISAAAERATALMRSMAALEPAPHDPSRVDRRGQAQFLRRKIELQRKLADLLVQHAEQSQSALFDLELQLEG